MPSSRPAPGSIVGGMSAPVSAEGPQAAKKGRERRGSGATNCRYAERAIGLQRGGRGHHRMNPRSADDTALLIRVAEGDPVRSARCCRATRRWCGPSRRACPRIPTRSRTSSRTSSSTSGAARRADEDGLEATFIATIARRRVIRRRRAGRRWIPNPRGRTRSRRERSWAAPGRARRRSRPGARGRGAAHGRPPPCSRAQRRLRVDAPRGAADTGIPSGPSSHIRRGLAEVTERLKARQPRSRRGDMSGNGRTATARTATRAAR